MNFGMMIASTEGGTDLNLALLFGLMVLLGTLASRVFQKFHIPQVVGCVIVGILLGDILGVITAERIEHLQPFTMLALGIIGFMIGGELRRDIFAKYGRQFFIILFSQGMGAFVLVAIAAALMAAAFGFDWRLAAAVGLLLGAVASATAPAATVNVLWEYKTRGPLTAAVLAIVALDDALALLLYRGAATGAQALLGTGHESVLHATGVLFAEIVGTILLGILAGFALYMLLKFVRADDKILGFSLAGLLLIVGVSMLFKIDPILPAMTFGVAIANLAPRQSKNVFGLVEKFSPPIYTTFFVLAGAHMKFGTLSVWMVAMITVYTIARALGKMSGSWLGAAYSKAPETVRRYLGLCLLPQAGVAIGLAILAGRQFDSEIGRGIVMIVMTGTFLMEIFGPMLVKVGVKKAGEVGLNITEEDLIAAYKVEDVMETKVPVITAGMSLSDVIKVFSATDSFYYSVVDRNSRLIGAITLDGIRNTFTTQELNEWLIALDIMEPVVGRTGAQVELADAFEEARKLGVEHLPVVAGQSNELLGLLDCRAAHRALTAEVLERQRKADTIHSAQFA